MITRLFWIFILGNVRSFIRDCSNGKNFFTDEINNQFEDNVVTNDNQTTCRYTGQGYIACVTLCGGPEGQGFKYGYGNFCNGPVSLAVATTISDLLIFFVIMFSSMYRYLWLQVVIWIKVLTSQWRKCFRNPQIVNSFKNLPDTHDTLFFW